MTESPPTATGRPRRRRRHDRGLGIDGTEEDVRYIGVDTPESVKPDTPVECYALRGQPLQRGAGRGRDRAPGRSTPSAATSTGACSPTSTSATSSSTPSSSAAATRAR